MMKTRKFLRLTFLSAVVVFAVQACNSGTKTEAEHDHGMVITDNVQSAPDNGVTKAICVLQPTAGNEVTGTITFTKTDAGT